MNFLLIQALCQISKRLYSESIPCDYLRTAPSRQIITYSWIGRVTALDASRRPSPPLRIVTSQVVVVTKVRNNDQINHLSLMIFIWLHSQDSQLLNKCSFCSIKSLFMSINLRFVGVFCSVIHWHKARSQQADKSL